MKKLLTSGLVAAGLLGLAATASAQDYTQPATYGNVTLVSGFTPDPHNIQLQSGGSTQVTQPGCTGYVANAPDYELTFTAGSLPLNIYVKSESDTTLLINLPDGSWACNDDTSGFNPAVLMATTDSATVRPNPWSRVSRAGVGGWPPSCRASP